MNYTYLEEEMRHAVEMAFHIDEQTERYKIFFLLQNMPEDIRTSKQEISRYLQYTLPNKEYMIVCRMSDLLEGNVKKMNDEEFEEFYINYLDILERQEKMASEKIKAKKAKAKKFLEKCFGYI